MRKISSFFVFISVLLSVAAASAQAPKAAETPALLYKISGNGLKKPSYLYGTIHIICPDDIKGMDKLLGFMDQTEQVLMELDMDDATEMQSMGAGAALPAGKTLNDYLTAEQYAKVDALFKEYVGVSVDAAKTVNPMFLSIMISTSPKVLGCNQPGSYELSFVQAAAAKKKPVTGLETVAQQLAKIGAKSIESHAKDLFEMALKPEKSISELKTMIALYKEQDNAGLYTFVDGVMPDKAYQKALLDDRNIDWTPKIEKAVKEKPTFIAVGAAHLSGPNGVIKLLRSKGYTLEPIRL